MATTRLTYLLDTSALGRLHHDAVALALRDLILARVVATCPVVDMEVLYSARGPKQFEQDVRHLRASFGRLSMNDAVHSRAAEVQALLAQRSQHRGAGPADLLIAACAEAHGATILHYDRDFDLISEVTGQPTLWVVTPGTVS